MSAPLARNCSTVELPVATATGTASAARAHATSCGSSPTTSTSEDDTGGMPQASARWTANGTSALRSGESSPKAPHRK
jgi:hypothetical protein